MSGSTCTVAEVRAAMDDAILAAMSSSGWQVSTQPYDLFFGAEGGHLADMAYAVGSPQSSIVEPRTDRRGGTAYYVHTRLPVAWSRRLGAQRQVTDYDAAMTDEASIIGAAVGTSLAGARYIFDNAQRSIRDGYVVGEIEIYCLHRMPV